VVFKVVCTEREFIGQRVLPDEFLESQLGVQSLLHAIGSDTEGELDVGVEADDVLDAVEPAVNLTEQFGQSHRAKFGGEKFHGQLVAVLGVDVAVISGVVAADLLSFEGDLTAGFTGGKVKGA